MHNNSLNLDKLLYPEVAIKAVQGGPAFYRAVASKPLPFWEEANSIDTILNTILKAEMSGALTSEFTISKTNTLT